MGLKDLFRRGKDDGADPRELEAAVARLADPDWEVRVEGCRALGRLGKGAQSAIPDLQRLIEDENDEVCTAAAAALSDIERDF